MLEEALKQKKPSIKLIASLRSAIVEGRKRGESKSEANSPAHKHIDTPASVSLPTSPLNKSLDSDFFLYRGELIQFDSFFQEDLHLHTFDQDDTMQRNSILHMDEISKELDRSVSPTPSSSLSPALQVPVSAQNGILGKNSSSPLYDEAAEIEKSKKNGYFYFHDYQPAPKQATPLPASSTPLPSLAASSAIAATFSASSQKNSMSKPPPTPAPSTSLVPSPSPTPPAVSVSPQPRPPTSGPSLRSRNRLFSPSINTAALSASSESRLMIMNGGVGDSGYSSSPSPPAPSSPARDSPLPSSLTPRSKSISLLPSLAPSSNSEFSIDSPSQIYRPNADRSSIIVLNSNSNSSNNSPPTPSSPAAAAVSSGAQNRLVFAPIVEEPLPQQEQQEDEEQEIEELTRNSSVIDLSERPFIEQVAINMNITKAEDKLKQDEEKRALKERQERAKFEAEQKRIHSISLKAMAEEKEREKKVAKLQAIKAAKLAQQQGQEHGYHPSPLPMEDAGSAASGMYNPHRQSHLFVTRGVAPSPPPLPPSISGSAAPSPQLNRSPKARAAQQGMNVASVFAPQHQPQAGSVYDHLVVGWMEEASQSPLPEESTGMPGSPRRHPIR